MLESLPKPPQDPSLLRRASWAVRTASRYTPWESNCLPQAIAAKGMLRCRAVHSTLYLDLKRSSQDKLEAHAWLRSGNPYIIGGYVSRGFTLVATFAEDG